MRPPHECAGTLAVDKRYKTDGQKIFAANTPVILERENRKHLPYAPQGHDKPSTWF
jgi:hypothetical protein